MKEKETKEAKEKEKTPVEEKEAKEKPVATQDKRKTEIKEKMKDWKGGKLEDEWEKVEPEPEDEIQAMLGEMNKAEEAEGTLGTPPETVNEKKLKEKDEKIRKLKREVHRKDYHIASLTETISKRNYYLSLDNNLITWLWGELKKQEETIALLKGQSNIREEKQLVEPKNGNSQWERLDDKDIEIKKLRKEISKRDRLIKDREYTIRSFTRGWPLVVDEIIEIIDKISNTPSQPWDGEEK